MAGSVVGYASAASGTTTLTVTKANVEAALGGTVTDGDLLVGVVSWDWGASSGVTASTGSWTTKFTQLGSGVADSNNTGIRTRLFLRTAASEPTSWSFAQPSGSDGTLTVVALRGVDVTPANIIAASQSTGTTTSTSQVTPTVDHAGTADSAMLAGAAIDCGGANTWTPPGGMTECGDVQSNTYTSHGVAYLLNPADPTGTKTFTNTFSGTQTSAGVQWGLVAPPVAGGTTTERVAPDAILAQTGLTGAVAAIQDDPDSPDGTWLTA